MPEHTVGPLLTRRACLSTLAIGGAALAAGCATTTVVAHANTLTEPGDRKMTPSQTRALPADHTPVALPFDPKKLAGLSERMIVSHHENNYGGAVKNLNRTEQELASINKDTPPLLVAALHERELNFRNSKTLHEAYFGNLGGDGKRSGAIETALAQAYGTSSHWEEQFRAAGAGLGGGSGWVMLNYEIETASLRIVSSMGHTQAQATAVPLLVMDMYEHSYQMDYGAAAAKYIDAFFANVQWDAVNSRFERAQRVAAVWTGRAT